MLKSMIVLLALTSCAFAQEKPQVTVHKMTDVEYKRLDDAGDAMQKAAESYRKAADAYEAAKQDILGKYNALDNRDQCGNSNKIVDIRGPYVIVEVKPSSNNGMTIMSGNFLTVPLIQER